MMAKKKISRTTFPAVGLVAITPSDVTALDGPCPAIHVSVGGAIKLMDLNGNTITVPFVAGGAIWPVGAQQIFSTGTTATGLFAVYNG